MSAGQSEPDRQAPLDGIDRAKLDKVATGIRRFIQAEMPYMYLDVNEVRARLEIEAKNVTSRDMASRQENLHHALQQLNGAKFCLEIVLTQIGDALE